MKMKFDLSKRKGAQVKSLVVRETNGEDEEIAAGWAKAKGGQASAAEELVRIAISEVDGKPVEQPFLGFDRWNSKTRMYALAAWKSLNIVEEKDLEDFLAAGQVINT